MIVHVCDAAWGGEVQYGIDKELMAWPNTDCFYFKACKVNCVFTKLEFTGLNITPWHLHFHSMSNVLRA